MNSATLAFIGTGIAVAGAILNAYAVWKASAEQDSLMKQLEAYQTGGDSYAWVLPAPPFNNAAFPMSVLNGSKTHSVFDVQVRVLHLVPSDPEFAAFRFIEAGTISRNGMKLVDGGVVLAPGKVNVLRIEIVARNGATFEVLTFDAEGKAKSYVVTDRDNKVLRKDP